MPADADTRLSRGARLCRRIIAASRPRRGGIRRCGRSYLAHRLGCSNRQVSRYLRELREAGELELIPPRRQWTGAGYRTIECNGFRISHRRRSRRGDIRVTPPPSGLGQRRSESASPRPAAPANYQSDGAAAPATDYAARAAEVRALIRRYRPPKGAR